MPSDSVSVKRRTSDIRQSGLGPRADWRAARLSLFIVEWRTVE